MFGYVYHTGKAGLFGQRKTYILALVLDDLHALLPRKSRGAVLARFVLATIVAVTVGVIAYSVGSIERSITI